MRLSPVSWCPGRVTSLIYLSGNLCQSFVEKPSRCGLDSLFLLSCIYLAMIQVIKVCPPSEGEGEGERMAAIKWWEAPPGEND